MNNRTELYSKLKRQAKYLLLKGDLERYMNALREIYELRAMRRGMSA
jgi:hypothetical protein